MRSFIVFGHIFGQKRVEKRYGDEDRNEYNGLFARDVSGCAVYIFFDSYVAKHV